MARFKRLPNGFGNINYLGSGRRNPYRARVNKGWKQNGQPQYVVVGYYDTYQNALMALSSYHRNPYEVQTSMTFAECFEEWKRDKFKTISESNCNGYEMSFKACECLHRRQMISITYTELETLMRDFGATRTKSYLSKIKVLLSQIFAWAVIHNVIPPDNDKVKYLPLTFALKPSVKKVPFSNQEVQILWDHADDRTVQIILILIYSGMRINELLSLKRTDVHMQERYYDIKQAKTEAGVRKIPIATKVLPFVASIMQENDSEYFIALNRKRVPYSTFVQSHFMLCLESLGMHHTAHECRHTCISMLDSAGVNKTTIKKIVGHVGDMTERVYTHKTIEELCTAIDMI